MNTLITEGYRKQQEWLHANTTYGVAAKQFAEVVSQIIDRLLIDELLDYGCGSRLTLLHTMAPKRRVKYQPYDPGVPQHAAEPDPMQMVTCIDVLEHIEPELLDNVLDDLQRLTLQVGFFSVHCGPSQKTLPDGRNVHVIQKPPEWWLGKITARWELQTFQRTENGAWFLVYPKSTPKIHIED